MKKFLVSGWLSTFLSATAFAGSITFNVKQLQVSKSGGLMVVANGTPNGCGSSFFLVKGKGHYGETSDIYQERFQNLLALAMATGKTVTVTTEDGCMDMFKFIAEVMVNN